MNTKPALNRIHITSNGRVGMPAPPMQIQFSLDHTKSWLVYHPEGGNAVELKIVKGPFNDAIIAWSEDCVAKCFEEAMLRRSEREHKFLTS